MRLVGPFPPDRNMPYSNAESPHCSPRGLGDVCHTAPFGMAGLPGYLVFSGPRAEHWTLEDLVVDVTRPTR